MAARLTDSQKRQIVADYTEMQSYSAVGAKHGISHHTVKKVVEELPETAEICQMKKEKNTQDILAYMDAQKGRVCDLIDLGLEVLTDRMREAKSATEVTTAMGTLIDKFTRQLPSQEIRVTDAELTLAEKMEIIRRAAEEYGH